MKYRYITVYQLRGLIHNPDRGDVDLYIKEGFPSVRALLTDKLDDHCYELDRAQSVGYLMLKSIFGKRESTELNVEVETEISRIRERRNKDLEGSEKLIFIAEGEANPDFSKPNREADDYILGFGIINKETISETYSDQLHTILAALFMSTEHEIIEVKKVRGDVFLINELGKPIYSFDFAGGGEAYLSRRTTDEVIAEAQGHSIKLMNERNLNKVYKLLIQAVSRDNDRLRRFMFSWSALEILINKVFSEYEKNFIENLTGADPAKHTQRYFDRIRDVMKDKYRLADKFVVVASGIGGDFIETDLEMFIKIKGTRDALFHGDRVDDETLPISETVKLLKKYLRRHINGKDA